MTPRRVHVLLVEQDEASRQEMASWLEEQNFGFDAASCVEEARRCLKSCSYHLVLLAHRTRDVGSSDLLQEIRNEHSLGELPVILISDGSDGEDVALGLQLGANDHVTRPIDFAAAVVRIRTQLALKDAEDRRQLSEQRYALAAAGSRDGLWDWDLTTDEVFFSERWKGLLGYSGREIGACLESWLDRIHPEDRPRVESDLKSHLERVASCFENEHRIRHKDGTYRWVLTRGLAIFDRANKPVRLAGSLSDISATKVIDLLTGMPNRLLFLDRLSRSIERSRRNNKHLFAVIFAEMDSEKLVTDSFGHEISDQLLVAFALRVEAELRSSDTIARFSERPMLARYSGGQFAILLDDVREPESAQMVAERLLQMMNQSFQIGEHEIYAKAYFGITIGDAGKRPDDLLREADTAMYHAKSAGRSRIQVFQAEMQQTALNRLKTETELRHAVERNEFENWYQPIVSLQTGEIVGVETLVRWNHPERGLVAPLDFIPVAEETGLIVQIGGEVLKDACQQLAAWSLKFGRTRTLSVSVNLSVRQIEMDLADLMRAAITEGGLEPSSLKLEITESVLMKNPDESKAVIHEFKNLGVRIVIDDFGTGYSSLSYLKDFPVDELKIDRSFVSTMERSAEKMKIVETIIQLASRLELEVTAEGIETKEQCQLLSQMGCDFGQGFYFSRPVPEPQATDLLEANLPWLGAPRAA